MKNLKQQKFHKGKEKKPKKACTEAQGAKLEPLGGRNSRTYPSYQVIGGPWRRSQLDEGLLSTARLEILRLLHGFDVCINV